MLGKELLRKDGKDLVNESLDGKGVVGESLVRKEW